MNENMTNHREGGDLPGFKVLADQCVWMKAGVVNFRACDRGYDCFNCPFDKAMRVAMDAQNPRKRGAQRGGWLAAIRKRYLGRQKPCVYFLEQWSGAPKTCLRDYDCDSCPVELALGYEPLRQSIAARRAEHQPGAAQGEERPLGFPFPNHECVWMKAGIIGMHLCDNDYDCYHCEFDRSMRAAMLEGPPQAGDAVLTAIGAAVEPVIRPCIYALIGRTDAPPLCASNYACHECPTHRAIAGEKSCEPRPIERPACRNVTGYPVAEGYYYHFGHTWVHVIHGGCVRVGVDGFVGKLLGPIDGVEIPAPGSDLERTRAGWVLSRGGHRAPVLCPLTGRILAVNPKVVETPATVSDDPYGDGWLFQMEPYDLKHEAQSLYSGAEAALWMEHDARELVSMLGPGYEKLSATGGEVVSDIYGHFPELGWDPLVRTFLRTAGPDPHAG